MKPSKHLIFELVLILSSVLVFRSLWTIIDQVPLLNTVPVNLLLLLAGVVLSLVSIHKLIHAD